MLLGAPPRCAGFTSRASSSAKTNHLRGKKWKERVTVRDGAHSSTIKQPTLSSYCQNPQAYALCGPGQPMDKQSSTQAPIIIFVSIQSFPNRIRDWSYYSKYVIIDFNISDQRWSRAAKPCVLSPSEEGKQWCNLSQLSISAYYQLFFESLQLLTRPGTNHAPLIPRPRDWEKLGLCSSAQGNWPGFCPSRSPLWPEYWPRSLRHTADKWQLQIRHKQFTRGTIHRPSSLVSIHGIPLMTKIAQIILLCLLAKFQSRLNCY